MATNRLKHLIKAHSLIAVTSGHHRPAADKDRREVHPAGRHQHTRHDFIAVGDENHRIHWVRGQHDLDRIGNQLPRTKRILHALVVHGQAVAYADGVESKRHTARIPDARLHSFCNRVQMGVTGYVIAFRADHCHKWAFHLTVGYTQCL